MHTKKRHGGFTLLVCASDAELGRGKLPARNGLVTEFLSPAPPQLRAADSAPQLYLVRPDGYLALRCELEESAEISRWLKTVLV